jgi:putative transcriptional regulator
VAQTPYLLAALPQLQDEEFARAVILIIQHDDEGAFGFVLNKPLVTQDAVSTQLVAEVQDAQGSTLFEFEEPLFRGGPVKEEMVFLIHDNKKYGDADGHIVDDLFVTADTQVFQEVLTQSDHPTRKSFFMGCTSWEPHQLDEEIRQGAWVMVPFDDKHLFQTPPEDNAEWSEEYWKKVLRSAGIDPFTLMTQGSSDFGPN